MKINKINRRLFLGIISKQMNYRRQKVKIELDEVKNEVFFPMVKN